MESKFNETDSMLVIREMIEQAKGNLKQGDGKYLVLWGYIITIACFAHYISYAVLDFGYVLSNYIWTILPIIGVIITFFLILKDRKTVVVRTYVGSMISRIWTGFGCTAFLVAFLLAGKNGIYIYPAISLVYAYATYLSANAFRMKWMYIPAAICAVCVILYRFVPFSIYPLLMGAMLVCGNLIPGHIINYKAKRHV